MTDRRVHTIYAILVDHPDDPHERLGGALTQVGMLPMVICGDDGLHELKKHAREMQADGMKVRLCQFIWFKDVSLLHS